MTNYCEDCGSKVFSYGCVYCNEESYIYYDQMLPEGYPTSEEFKDKVKEQQNGQTI